MVWGCFSSKGIGNITFINVNLDSNGYIELLSSNLKQSVESMGLKDYIFQQDNVPCHKSKMTFNILLLTK